MNKITNISQQFIQLELLELLLEQELLTFCCVIYSNLSKKMSSHFKFRITLLPPAFFSADAHDYKVNPCVICVSQHTFLWCNITDIVGLLQCNSDITVLQCNSDNCSTM